MTVLNKLKNCCLRLKDDKILGMIFFLHIALATCHFCHAYISEIHYHGDLRFAGCILIAALIFFFGRIGMAFGFMIYACSLIYVNTFYNYGTIFFMLIAVGAYPRIKHVGMVLYLANVIISFSIQRLLPFSVAIHVVYIILFYLCTRYVYKVNSPKKLNLNEDERKILDELLDGKLQKEIDLFSQPTITAKIKNAKERNMCETTAELLSLYMTECGVKIGKCGKPCKKNCPKRDTCCMTD